MACGIVWGTRNLARLASGFTVVVGAAALLGYASGIRGLARPVPIGPFMVPMTAAIFVLAGASLWLLAPCPAAKTLPRLAGQVLGWLVAIAGAVVVAEYGTGRSAGIELLLFPDRTRAWSVDGNSGQPALSAAVAFVAVGMTLALLDFDASHGYRPARILLPTTVLLTVMVTLGSAYNLSFVTSPAIGLALNTNAILVILTMGLVICRPQLPPARVFCGHGPGALAGRRMAPVLALVLFVGILAILASGGRMPDAGLAVTAITMLLLLALYLVFARAGAALDNAQREREEFMRQLEARERLEALGVLAGGVAHDFNNALATILGTAALIAEDLGPEHPSQPDIERIRASAQRSADLTSQLLIFARQEPRRADAVDVVAAIRGIEDLIRRTIGEDIDFDCQTADGLPPVTLDRSDLEQVVLNLAINARHAMTGGGSLTIRVAPLTQPAAATPSLPMPAGRYIHIAVADTGTGMPPEVVRHAFEPFFTTKPVGQGTGLGLANVYGVVTQANGHITIDSEPGCGTTVNLYLPATTAAEPGTSTPARTAPTGHAETILLVEDEPGLRHTIARTMTRHGYRILEARSADEATGIFHRPAVNVDLLLTDVIMPGSSGYQLAEQLHEETPDLPVVFMSGYTATAPPDDDTTHFICKPFSSQELLTAVSEALRGPQG
ncbi:signal transduction histidine kinase [Actinoplanes campanulatus]|uniref:histidine kinase n=1 Tax=Actinoplanes campanulatus TaxID=113559 RepID=A0A7W5AKM7_9ACTN|nr:ATP-binding protein [Actinoplanes campanulatus]MBB3097624.1 signal transduction histidine kinase [Actinoplanes campanulatus]GGN27917.1 hypothetical protein GCM10010109_45960 [Actinoplanes campanulatus]GID37912.1 hypothetical protein Aca09nite_44180 [Actinoplanes campanulatus]